MPADVAGTARAALWRALALALALAPNLHASGEREQARARSARAFDIAPDFYLAHCTQATLQAAEGRLDLADAALRRAAAQADTALAIDALEHAYAVRDTQLVFLNDDSRWAALRREPGFVALRVRLKLDRYGPGLSPS